MKKNFYQNLSKLSKSLNQSTNKFFLKSKVKQQQAWWRFGQQPSQTQNNPFNKIKKIFFPQPTNKSNDSLNKIKQQLRILSSKQNQALLQSFKNKMKETTEQSMILYGQKANEIKAKLLSTLKESKIPLKQQDVQLLKKKSFEAGQMISNKASSFKEKISTATEKIGRKSQKIPEKLGKIGKISGKVYEYIKQKVDVKKNVEKTFNNIFWRAVLLLGIVAFAYGFGTSLPREIRSVIKEIYANDNREGSEVGSSESVMRKVAKGQQGK